jgi:hypothetical protein
MALFSNGYHDLLWVCRVRIRHPPSAILIAARLQPALFRLNGAARMEMKVLGFFGHFSVCILLPLPSSVSIIRSHHKAVFVGSFPFANWSALRPHDFELVQ